MINSPTGTHLSKFTLRLKRSHNIFNNAAIKANNFYYSSFTLRITYRLKRGLSYRKKKEILNYRSVGFIGIVTLKDITHRVRTA